VRIDILELFLSSFPAGANTIIGNSPSILQAITDPRVDLAIQERQLADDVKAWLEDVPTEAFPRGRVLIHIGDIDVVLTAMMQAAGTPDDPRADGFRTDVAFLARTFATIAQIDIVDVRLEVISHDACWRFHRDLVEMRLLTTYRGPSTQIVPVSHGADALRVQQDYDGPVSDLPPHAVAIFKGGNMGSGKGVVHRSPPIAGSGIHRFVLCINKISNASPERWHI
jgi:hypothetical protein